MKYGYNLLTTDYSYNKKLKYICPNGHVGEITFNKFQQGRRCIECSAHKKYKINEVNQIFKSRGYTLIDFDYKNNHTPLYFICDKEHISQISLKDFLNGKGCKYCHFNNLKKLISKGDIIKNNIPLYDTYAPQLNWIEDVRRDPENNDLLQVKCSENNCKKWFTPKRTEVRRRLTSLRTGIGENRFYCSDECKNKCSVFNQVLYPKTFIKDDITREVQQELRELVFQRDEHECQKCGNDTDLHCHHFEGVEQNPIESADIDNCITLCSECHKMAHEDEGCRYVDLKKDKLCLN